MHTLEVTTDRKGRDVRIGLAPNGTIWTRTRLSTGRMDYWRQVSA